VNIPFVVHTYRWETDLGRVAIEMNPSFVPEIQSWAEPTDTILVMCRSGGRAATAVNVLADVGYTIVYNILEGMEGERVNDPRRCLPVETALSTRMSQVEGDREANKNSSSCQCQHPMLDNDRLHVATHQRAIERRRP
jgi:hypothetical protein